MVYRITLYQHRKKSHLERQEESRNPVEGYKKGLRQKSRSAKLNRRFSC